MYVQYCMYLCMYLCMYVCMYVSLSVNTNTSAEGSQMLCERRCSEWIFDLATTGKPSGSLFRYDLYCMYVCICMRFAESDYESELG